MFLRYNAFAIAWAILIVFLTLFPGKEMPEMTIWDMVSFDKFAHMFVFAIFTLLMIVGFSKQYTYAVLKRHPVRSALLVSIFLGGVIEIAQSIIPGRGFDYLDFVADALGSLLGYVAFYFIYQFRISKK
ncbi:MAG: VanZ family protein [Cytophagaceae bacterium]